MSIKEFLKKILMNYFIIVTGITVAITVIGMKFYPDVLFTYKVFLSPLLYGAAATLPAFIMYSKKELTLKKMLFRKICYLVLLEISQLVAVQLTGLVTDMTIMIYLFFTVFCVYLFTIVMGYIIDRKTAIYLNHELKRFQLEDVKINH